MTIKDSTMQKVKKTERGMEFKAKISNIGTINMPKTAREAVGKTYGDKIKVIVPLDQGAS
jgi:bifunctional DNA-binding transcriptional regulator/antitoxin component of YhaV-PrlF toxin-antitoxin module